MIPDGRGAAGQPASQDDAEPDASTGDDARTDGGRALPDRPLQALSV